MTRWLPFPRVAVAVLAIWLLLVPSITPGNVLLGVMLALTAPRLLAALRHDRRGARGIGAMARLAARVLVDITQSNLAVAAIILRPRPRPRRAGFVRIPLRLHEPNGLAVLACIITATPGTIWAAYDPARGVLLIHVLDLIDEETWIVNIQQRYETLLLEIFP